MSFVHPKQYKMKIQIFNDQPDYGPGVSTLMSLVRETHSLRQACSSIGMSYSKAWKIIQKAEADLGIKLIEGTAGGHQGGGSKLTPEGEALLDEYESFVQEAHASVDALFHKHFDSF